MGTSIILSFKNQRIFLKYFEKLFNLFFEFEKLFLFFLLKFIFEIWTFQNKYFLCFCDSKTTDLQFIWICKFSKFYFQLSFNFF